MERRGPGVPALSTTRRPRRPAHLLAAAAVVGAGAVLLLPGAPAGAHPLGNFTTNTSAALLIGVDRIEVDYVVDRAEIPTLQERADIDRDGDDELSDTEREAYATESCAALAQDVEVTIGGTTVALQVDETDLSVPDGQAGLPTQRLDCELVADHAPVTERTAVTFVDEGFDEVLGWREVTGA